MNTIDKYIIKNKLNELCYNFNLTKEELKYYYN